MNEKKLTPNHLAILFTLLAALFTLGAAVYSYTGPNRTVATQVASCVYEKQKCEYIASKDQYSWHVVDSVSCSSESKPWLMKAATPAPATCITPG